MRRRRRPEETLHRAAAAYLLLLENLGELVFFHPANGGARSRTEAAIQFGFSYTICRDLTEVERFVCKLIADYRRPEQVALEAGTGARRNAHPSAA